ncbi:MAG: hypothetical protein HOL45_11820, partial [Chloroflexi bacterium]|nr:hypothetical protein [Chloroflexota bacterium]
MTLNSDTSLLSAALDRVIPPVDDLPGAGGMGLAGEVVKRCEADSRFNAALTTVIGALPSPNDFTALDDEGQDGALRTVESSDPDAFGLWLDVVYAIYYMQPAVHRRLSWHGRTPQPEGNV